MKYLVCIVFCCIQFVVFAQKPGRYRITFTDKNNSIYSTSRPNEFLSDKALERRNKYSIDITTNDIPVNSWYIDSVTHYGARLCNISKWFNSAIFECDSTTNFSGIHSLPCVASVVWVAPKHKAQPDATSLKFEQKHDVPYSDFYSNINEELYGNSIRQIKIMNGMQLHTDGYMGQGMTIAVLDAGFLHVDSATAFSQAWQEQRIIASKDFSGAHVSVWGEGYHGMAVLSLIGAYLPKTMIGTAPRASYVLCRTEEGATEYTVEEDNWVAAAEFADSLGVDVISTSLGYSEFDDSTQNYTYKDMNGNTTRITVASNIAASKGMLLFNSAGNSGDKPWKYVTAPADSDSIITVGACYITGKVTSFSSRGPSNGSTLKPDVVALGHLPAILKSNGLVQVSGMGTSFSNPILAGMATCLWQEFPNLPPYRIKQAIIASSHTYFNPDTINGHGIPDFEKARFILRMGMLQQTFDKAEVYPNPFRQILNVRIYASQSTTVGIRMYDMNGKHMLYKSFKMNTLLHTIEIPEAASLPAGMYTVFVEFDNEQQIMKVLKK